MFAFPPLVVFAGPPGAGKGTQCQRLVAQYGMAHISIGDALRQEVDDQTPLGSRVQTHVEAGRLVPDTDVCDVVAGRLGRHRTVPAVLLDGFPRTLGQAQILETLCPEGVALVVLLALPLTTAVSRLVGRRRADDSDPGVIQERLASYDRDTAPVLSWYASRGVLAHIDADAPAGEVTARIERHLAASGLGTPATGSFATQVTEPGHRWFAAD